MTLFAGFVFCLQAVPHSNPVTAPPPPFWTSSFLFDRNHRFATGAYFLDVSRQAVLRVQAIVGHVMSC